MDGWIQMNELVVVLRDEEEDQGEKEREREGKEEEHDAYRQNE